MSSATTHPLDRTTAEWVAIVLESNRTLIINRREDLAIMASQTDDDLRRSIVEFDRRVQADADDLAARRARGDTLSVFEDVDGPDASESARPLPDRFSDLQQGREIAQKELAEWAKPHAVTVGYLIEILNVAIDDARADAQDGFPESVLQHARQLVAAHVANLRTLYGADDVVVAIH
jgi:hypothetical protein